MKALKLYRFLAALNEEELHHLEKYLRSPYHNTNQQIYKLFQYLRPFHPHFQNVSRTAIYAHFFPGKSARAKWLNDRFSELSLCIEGFLIQEELRNCADHRTTLLQLSYRKRGQYQDLLRLIERRIEEIKEQGLQDHAMMQEQIRLQRELFDLPPYSQKSNGLQIVRQVLYFNELQYLLVQLPYTIDLLARQNTYREAMERLIPDDLLQQARQFAPHHPLLALYLILYDAYREGSCSITAFTQAADLLGSLTQHLPTADATFCLIKLCGLGLAEVYRGDSTYLPYLFDLYRLGIEKHLFTRYGYLPDDTFLNVCTYGAYSGAHHWTSAFIEQYAPQLPADVRENATALGKAILAFHRKQFTDVRDLLDTVSSNRLQYKLRIRSLLVRCLLELHLQDVTYGPALMARIRTHERSYRRESRLSPKRQKAYLNLYRMIRAIAHLRESAWQQAAAHRQLEKTIEATQPLMLKQWLLDKLVLHPTATGGE